MEYIVWYSLGVIPLVALFAHVLDVSLETLRIIFTSRGKRNVTRLPGYIAVSYRDETLQELTAYEAVPTAGINVEPAPPVWKAFISPRRRPF